MTQTSSTATPLRETDTRPSEVDGFFSWVALLVHAHRGRLLGYAKRRGFDAEDALDAVQDSFVSFLKLPEARQIANVEEDSLKLLTVILRHNLQNRSRLSGRRARALALAELAEATDADWATSDSLIAQAEELSRVHGCIALLAKLQREVVMLSLLDEQPRERVARLLGISEGHVRVLLHRARMHIRACGSEHGTSSAKGR
jgi:RNA polymerase sigma factor (sigma-70 family)